MLGFVSWTVKYALYTSRPDQGCFFAVLTDVVVSEDIDNFPVEDKIHKRMSMQTNPEKGIFCVQYELI